MNTRTAFVVGFVSILSAVSGCARPAVAPAAAQSPRPVVAFAVEASGGSRAQPREHPARFEVAIPMQTRLPMLGSRAGR